MRFLATVICQFLALLSCAAAEQVPPLRFLNIGGNSIGDDGASIVGAGLVAAAGMRLLMLRFIGLDNNSMYVHADFAVSLQSCFMFGL